MHVCEDIQITNNTITNNDTINKYKHNNNEQLSDMKNNIDNNCNTKKNIDFGNNLIPTLPQIYASNSDIIL